MNQATKRGAASDPPGPHRIERHFGTEQGRLNPGDEAGRLVRQANVREHGAHHDQEHRRPEHEADQARQRKAVVGHAQSRVEGEAEQGEEQHGATIHDEDAGSSSAARPAPASKKNEPASQRVAAPVGEPERAEDQRGHANHTAQRPFERRRVAQGHDDDREQAELGEQRRQAVDEGPVQR